MEWVYVFNSVLVLIIGILTLITYISLIRLVRYNENVVKKKQGFEDKEIVDITETMTKVKSVCIAFLVILFIYITTDSFGYTVHFFRSLF
ncbi:hypothetical protein ACQUY5_18650 [Bacillus cereus]|uniref:hypothetical protein n=1 Tax=Bacillus cereus TaxID=1396 RepID=UPI003D173480